MNQKYSVLMSIYCKETSEHLSLSLDSMLNQTVKPEEIVIVEDGPLTSDLHMMIEKYVSKYPDVFTIHRIKKNHGLGYALAEGLTICRNDLVARMDTDDYAIPTRMQVELELMCKNNLDIVGSQVSEFEENIGDIKTHSKLPVTYQEIVRYSKIRNPFRHPTILFRREVALKAGNYSDEYPYFEDWDLFYRMLQNGAMAQNVDQELVRMRISPDFYLRRGGVQYAKYIWKFKSTLFKCNYINLVELCISAFPHMLISVMPNNIRSYVYNNLLRKNNG